MYLRNFFFSGINETEQTLHRQSEKQQIIRFIENNQCSRGALKIHKDTNMPYIAEDWYSICWVLKIQNIGFFLISLIKKAYFSILDIFCLTNIPRNSRFSSKFVQLLIVLIDVWEKNSTFGHFCIYFGNYGINFKKHKQVRDSNNLGQEDLYQSLARIIPQCVIVVV